MQWSRMQTPQETERPLSDQERAQRIFSDIQLRLHTIGCLFFENMTRVWREHFASHLSLYTERIALQGARVVGDIGNRAVCQISNFVDNLQQRLQLGQEGTLSLGAELSSKAAITKYLERYPRTKKLKIYDYKERSLPFIPSSVVTLEINSSTKFNDTSSIPSGIKELSICHCQSLEDLDLSHLHQLSDLNLLFTNKNLIIRLHHKTPFYKKLFEGLQQQIQEIQTRFQAAAPIPNAREGLFDHIQRPKGLQVSQHHFARFLLFALYLGEDPTVSEQRHFFKNAGIDKWVQKALSLRYLGNNEIPLDAFLREAIPLAFRDTRFGSFLQDQVSTALASCSDRLDLSFYEISRGISVYRYLEELQKGPRCISRIGDEGVDMLYCNLFASHYIEEKVKQYAISLAGLRGIDSRVGGVSIYTEELTLYSDVAPKLLSELSASSIKRFTKFYYQPKLYFNLGFGRDEKAQFCKEARNTLMLSGDFWNGAQREEEVRTMYQDFIVNSVGKNQLLTDLFDALKARGYFQGITPFSTFYNKLNASGQLDLFAIGTEVQECRNLFREQVQSLSQRDFPFLHQDGCAIS